MVSQQSPGPGFWSDEVLYEILDSALSKAFVLTTEYNRDVVLGLIRDLHVLKELVEKRTEIALQPSIPDRLLVIFRELVRFLVYVSS